MRASIAAHREQLSALQREGSSLRATLEEREALEAQASELRTRLVAAKAWQLHRQLIAAQRDGRAALEALEAEVSAASAERQQLDAELTALSADRDRLLLEVSSCVQSKQSAAAQLVAAKRDLAFATLDSEAAAARSARARLTSGGSTGAAPGSALGGADSRSTAPPPLAQRSAPASLFAASPSAAARDADVLAAAEADSAATLAEMRSLLLSLQAASSGTQDAHPLPSRGLLQHGPPQPLPADADLADEMRQVAVMQAALL